MIHHKILPHKLSRLNCLGVAQCLHYQKSQSPKKWLYKRWTTSIKLGQQKAFSESAHQNILNPMHSSADSTSSTSATFYTDYKAAWVTLPHPSMLHTSVTRLQLHRQFWHFKYYFFTDIYASRGWQKEECYEDDSICTLLSKDSVRLTIL